MTSVLTLPVNPRAAEIGGQVTAAAAALTAAAAGGQPAAALAPPAVRASTVPGLTGGWR